MKGEIPVCKRCCFCLPLRYGLLVWGYFKMTVDAIIITSISYSMIQNIMMIKVHGPDDHYQNRIAEEMIVPIIAVAVFIADFVATIVFIIGGHKKNARLMSVFCVISIVMVIFTILITAMSAILLIKNVMTTNIYFWLRSLIMVSFYFLVLAVQSYFLMLLRSEIMKLENLGEFRFVNNAAESECTMMCEEIRAENEIRTEEKRAVEATNREGV